MVAELVRQQNQSASLSDVAVPFILFIGSVELVILRGKLNKGLEGSTVLLTGERGSWSIHRHGLDSHALVIVYCRCGRSRI